MNAQRHYIGETEFSRVGVELNDADPYEWPTIEITVRLIRIHDEQRCLVVSMDEARMLIGALAWVIR